MRLNTQWSRKSAKPGQRPRKITFGRASVSVYRRTAPNDSLYFMVANYATSKRRFDSYATHSLRF